MELDNLGRALLQILAAHLPLIKPGDPRSYISYKQVHDQLNLSLEGATYGESLKSQGLDSLAKWTYVLNKPGITGIIIDARSLMPGDGYFKLFNGAVEDFQWWKSEVIKSKNYDWLPYLYKNQNLHLINGVAWSFEELSASVHAYFEMVQFQRLKQNFIKQKYYDALSKKFGRSAKAYEYRMQNISYILSLLGREWLHGLKPAKNVGANIAAIIEKLIFEVDGWEVSPVSFGEISVLTGMKNRDLPPPKGVIEPKVVLSMNNQFQRSIEVRTWILRGANDVCECCSKHAPFIRTDGFAYLEVHHIRRLSDRGSDTISNAVAVCPNCHRELHYGEDSERLVKGLFQRLSRLREE